MPDASLRFERQDDQATFVYNDKAESLRRFTIPLYTDHIQNVTINSQQSLYHIEPGIGVSYLIIETDQTGELILKVDTQGNAIEKLVYGENVKPSDRITITTPQGRFVEVKDPSGCLEGVLRDEQRIIGSVTHGAGNHTIFLRVQEGDWDGWLCADLVVARPDQPKPKAVGESTFQTVDISSQFNMSLTEIHQQEYRSPRPKGYSIMACLNGRFGWSWNHAGQYKVIVDDSSLRNCGGTWRSESGIPFITPSQGANAICVSIWDNYPNDIAMKLLGRADELAIWLIGSTSPMQAQVENARFVVEYADGTFETVSLVNPDNFDDWLTAAFQKENESQYFSEYNHAIIQRISLNPKKALKSFKAKAIANEVVVGILGLTLIQYEK